ncbi:type II secretion system F family protein [Streptomyces boninensis]|uniref:type II secretion system F family protein n=1 Tax=Streptomyces boninensis TaxID=2039455 RepID=UPI003B223E02
MNGAAWLQEMDVLLAAGLGAVLAGGAWVALHGLRYVADLPGVTGRVPRMLRQLVPARWHGRRLVGAVGVGVALSAVTGWPVGGLLAAVGALTLPELLGPDRQAARRTERLDALAVWTEMLRDTLSAAAGLEQTIQATARVAPAALRGELGDLTAALRAGRPLPEGLAEFANAVADPLADKVVVTLRLAAAKEAGQLAPVLGALAVMVREEVAMRQRIDASRTSIRTSVRVSVTTTLVLAAVLLVFNRAYLAPFSSVLGQVALAVVGALFGASFWWLGRLAQMRAPERLLAPGSSGRVGVS